MQNSFPFDLILTCCEDAEEFKTSFEKAQKLNSDLLTDSDAPPAASEPEKEAATPETTEEEPKAEEVKEEAKEEVKEEATEETKAE